MEILGRMIKTDEIIGISTLTKHLEERVSNDGASILVMKTSFDVYTKQNKFTIATREMFYNKGTQLSSIEIKNNLDYATFQMEYVDAYRRIAFLLSEPVPKYIEQVQEAAVNEKKKSNDLLLNRRQEGEN